MTTSEITEHAVAAADELPPGGARAYAVGATMVAVFRLRSGELLTAFAATPGGIGVRELRVHVRRGGPRV